MSWRSDLLTLRGLGAGIIFIVVLIAYTVQTELAQHVQQRLGYKKPYLLLYLTHSGESIDIPLAGSTDTNYLFQAISSSSLSIS